MLSYAAGQGFRTQTIAGSHVRLGESYAGRVAKERRLIRVPDLREKSQPPHLARMIAEEGFITYIAVPLMVKGRVKGVLEVFHRALLQTYPEWLDFLTMLAGQTAIAVENANLVENMQQSNRDLTEAYDAAIEGWSHAMDLRDKETVGHSQRVTELTVKVARAMGIDEDQLIHIRRGALLHDIGKLAIPDHILFKPGKLTSEEWAIMQKHPEFAYEMLAPIRYLKPALPIPYFHHEKWDGTGYPLGLRGEQIPLEARVFAVTDVWDALLSDRPYRKAWTVERTLEYISSLAGSHFDHEVVECFLAVIKTAS
jgi:putative nucleotidyltransferase with HDIG domain